MARDTRSLAVAQAWPAEFAALCTQLWSSEPDGLNDSEFRQVANEVALNNASSVILGARIAAGDALDFSTVPDLAQRLNAAGATDESLREFVSAAYPHLSHSAAMRAYAADIQRARGADVPAEPKTTQSRFDRPF